MVSHLLIAGVLASVEVCLVGLLLLKLCGLILVLGILVLFRLVRIVFLIMLLRVLDRWLVVHKLARRCSDLSRWAGDLLLFSLVYVLLVR